ncbi:BTAD domain-containing putative transcriptional regulator [Streptomyces sp. NPDC002446]
MTVTGAPLRVQLLGPLRAWRHDEELVLGPPKQRAVLSLLASRANEVVGVDDIVDALWGSDVPQTATNGVHTYVGGLRRALDPGRGRRAASTVLTSESGGYCLRTDPDEVDIVHFTRCHVRARRLRGEGDAATALRLYEDALSLWHGEAYAGIPGPFAAMERTRLRDLRLTAVEEWAADMLDAGRHVEAVGELSRAVPEEPLREKLRWLLMLALYRGGRQAEALSVYAETRQLLNGELGIEPGAELRTLHQQILTGHPEPRTPGAGSAPAAGGGTRQSAPPEPLRPAQLPAAARGFVGREDELARLEGLLEEEPAGRRGAATAIAVVDGPAGVGKSALVLELARRLLDRFPDGQLYVDLNGTELGGRSLSASEALLQLLGGLGVDTARIPPDLAGRAALYRSVLHGKRMLVVLDDALNADQLRPLIPRGPSCVLATSRQRLSGLAARDGAHLVTLRPLPVDASVQLLVGLSEGRLSGQESLALRLARVCGGLPLALRIAASVLVGSPEVPLAALVER